VISSWIQHPPRSIGLVVSALLTMLTMLTMVMGCHSLSHESPFHAEHAESLHRIIKSGELRVGMTGSQPPLNMRNKRGKLIGLDVELARALADAMDLELVLVETPFADLISDLEAGKIDLVISSLTITPARNARVAFAGPYLISGSSLLTREELLEEITNLSGLNSAERTWAALEGSTGEELILEVFPLAKFVMIEDRAMAIDQIARGELDGLIADLPFVSFQLAQKAELGLATLPSPFTTEPLGIALPPNSPLFANLVQNYLNTLDNTGQLIQMKARWLNAGDWMSEMPGR
jgi:polar amino acid transport system substrate-binding protein